MRWPQHRAPTVDANAGGNASDAAIVSGIRAGDAHAFDAMVVAHYESLVRLGVSYLDDRESAEEAVQDVLLRVWRDRQQWSPNGPVRIYLFTAVRNAAFSQLRHRQVERRLEVSAAAGNDVLPFTPTPESADARQRTAELDAALRAAVSKLPPRMREAFVLSRQQHLSHDEIGRVMGTSSKTVQEQIGRALKALRVALADWL